MKKHILALLLALTMLTIPALAAKENQPQRVKTYEGQFSDLLPDSSFYHNVAALYEYGLSVGKTDGTFGLRDSLTVGQTVIFASRVRSLYVNGDPELGANAFRTEGQAAYEPHLRYLQAEGALAAELDGLYFSPATRAQVAHVLAYALPQNTLLSINDELVTEGYALRRYITDVTEYTEYAEDILFLYRTGISQGSSADGAFLPDQPITRGAMAAMLTRMVDPSLRITLTWSLEAEIPPVASTTLAGLVAAGEYVAAPATPAEMNATVRHMLAAGEDTLVLQYESLSAIRAREIMLEALNIVKTYCEQCYNGASCTFTTDGQMELQFTAASAGDRLEEYRDFTIEAAIAVHDQLWEDGILTPNMSDWDKARIYFDWICANCIYDNNASDNSLSHIAYNLFARGKAVCDGYTGAYNLLLKLEGIPCLALPSGSHIWTVAILDGQEYHIDTTWADSGPQVDTRFFGMTPEESFFHHPW